MIERSVTLRGHWRNPDLDRLARMIESQLASFVGSEQLFRGTTQRSQPTDTRRRFDNVAEWLHDAGTDCDYIDFHVNAADRGRDVFRHYRPQREELTFCINMASEADEQAAHGLASLLQESLGLVREAAGPDRPGSG